MGALPAGDEGIVVDRLYRRRPLCLPHQLCRIVKSIDQIQHHGKKIASKLHISLVHIVVFRLIMPMS